MVDMKELEKQEDVFIDGSSGTAYKITGFRNANKYPMSIRTAAWSMTVNPESYVEDRNGNKITTKKLMPYVGPGRLSVEREVVKSVQNFLRGDKKSTEETEEGTDDAVGNKEESASTVTEEKEEKTQKKDKSSKGSKKASFKSLKKNKK